MKDKKIIKKSKVMQRGNYGWVVLDKDFDYPALNFNSYRKVWVYSVFETITEAQKYVKGFTKNWREQHKIVRCIMKY